jgi:hypothetical protein
MPASGIEPCPPPRVQEAATLRVDSQTAYIIVIKYLFTVTFTVSGNHFYFCMNHFLSLEEPRAIKGRLTPGQSNGIHTESRSTLCHPLRRNILSSLHSFTELSATEPWSKLTRITFCWSSVTTGSRHVSKTSSAWFIVLYTETMNMYIWVACLTHLADLRIGNRNYLNVQNVNGEAGISHPVNGPRWNRVTF